MCLGYANTRRLTRPQFEFSVALRPQRPYGLRIVQDGYLDFHTASELCQGRTYVSWL